MAEHDGSRVLKTGTVLASRYRVEEVVGSGAMATVYRALDVIEHRRVAVKVLRPDLATRDEAVARLEREAEVLRALSHPAIVSGSDFGKHEDGTVFVAMELLEGETLGARMKRGTMSPEELAPIVTGICVGLHAAHQNGVVHRDLKPDNVFLVPLVPQGVQVKLLDFGISKVFGTAERLTHTGEILGTPRYMSPEQLAGDADLDGRVDTYALGVILYEALTGQPPFAATTPTDLVVAILNGTAAPLRTMRPDLPEALEAVVTRAMAKDRVARFDSPMALAESYLDAAGGASAPSKRPAGATVVHGGPSDTPVRQSAPTPLAAATPSPIPPRGRGSGLPIGTFSALEEAPTPAAPPVTRLAMDSLDPGPAPARKVAPTVEASYSIPSPTPADRPTEVPALPPAGPSGMLRAVVVVLALLAGGASAAAGVLIYRWATQPTATPTAEPRAVSPVDASDSGPADQGPADAGPEVAMGEDPPEPATPTPTPTPTRRTRRTRGRSTRTAQTEPERIDETPPRRPDAGPPAREETSLADLSPGAALGLARRALRAGEPERCLEVVEAALASRALSGAALRQRAACHDALGRRAAAVADYQRFCRLFGDNPAIGEVRRIMAGWGRSCP